MLVICVLWTKYFCQLSVLVYPQFVFVLECKRSGSHQCITEGKIMALYFSIYVFRQEKRSLINFVANVNFISFEDNESVTRLQKLYIKF